MCYLSENCKKLVLEATVELTRSKMCFTAQNVWDLVKSSPIIPGKVEVNSYVRELWNRHNPVFDGYAVTALEVPGRPLCFFPTPGQIKDYNERVAEAIEGKRVLEPFLSYGEEKKKSETSPDKT